MIRRTHIYNKYAWFDKSLFQLSITVASKKAYRIEEKTYS